jgi:hypothetical protein
MTQDNVQWWAFVKRELTLGLRQRRGIFGPGERLLPFQEWFCSEELRLIDNVNRRSKNE